MGREKTTSSGQSFRFRYSKSLAATDTNFSLIGYRMLFLNRTNFVPGQASQILTIRAPPNKNVAPPGDYVLYVVADGIPAIGKVVRIT